MSESSSTIDTLFQTPRNLVDRTIETQETINRQGLDLTRSAVRPIAGFVPGDADREEQVDDAFDTVDEQQSQFLEGIQSVADRTFETSEDAAEWGYDLVDRQVGRLQRAEESAEETAEEALESAEETAQEAADTAQETAQEAADTAQETAQEAAETTQETAEDAVDSAGDAVDEFQSELDDATDEFDAFDAFDDTAVEGLVEDGVETISDLASAEAEAVADAADASTDQAEEWIDAAVEREGKSLGDLEGIGETYADRLASDGIRTVDQLARTSADEVASSAEVGEERAAEWIQQAQDAA